jgi:type I restriction enzyme S subunit
MEFKQYPSYKNSGVEWLGDVPEHWDSCNLKFISKIYAGGTPDRNRLDYWVKGEIPWINSGAVNQVIIKEPSEYITELGLKNSSAKYIPVNSLVMALAGQGKTKGMVAYTSIETTCNQSMAAIVPKNYHYKFLYYWLDSNYQNIRNLTGGDNRDGLNLAVLSNIPCPKISIVEQTQIVSFLDTETARIDNLIAKQEKLIELLEEQRKSIISHAVTKGLNPNAPMKDSGVEWLGDVPEHWEVFQLKSAIKGWRNGKWGNEPAAENNICCVRVADFDRTKGVINTTKLTYRNYHGENISECILDENSILIERSGGGEKQLVGATVVNTLKQTAVCSNFISLLNINPNRVNIFFLQKCFENLYTRKVNEKSIKQTSGIQNLDLKQYLQNNIAYPSLDEQKSIVSYLDAECKKIDLLVDKQYQLIRKLKNYRTSIISHAVTGKIDVREFGA